MVVAENKNIVFSLMAISNESLGLRMWNPVGDRA
jgi:hypothetical protein